MIPPANNAQKFTPNLAAQNCHGTHNISRKLHSIKAFTWSKQFHWKTNALYTYFGRRRILKAAF